MPLGVMSEENDGTAWSKAGVAVPNVSEAIEREHIALSLACADGEPSRISASSDQPAADPAAPPGRERPDPGQRPPDLDPNKQASQPASQDPGAAPLCRALGEPDSRESNRCNEDHPSIQPSERPSASDAADTSTPHDSIPGERLSHDATSCGEALPEKTRNLGSASHVALAARESPGECSSIKAPFLAVKLRKTGRKLTEINQALPDLSTLAVATKDPGA